MFLLIYPIKKGAKSLRQYLFLYYNRHFIENMTKTVTNLTVLYTLLAVFSTMINISFQLLSIWFYQGIYAVEISILIGTVAALPLRFILDKLYIFSHKSDGLINDTRIFILYTLIGLITTAIFWGFEYAFHLIFKNEYTRYVGGLIGLTIGFFVKYELDKKYVFNDKKDYYVFYD